MRAFNEPQKEHPGHGLEPLVRRAPTRAIPRMGRPLRLASTLHRMDEAGWVSSEWGVSENNRRARYYRITSKGRRRLAELEKHWVQHVEAVNRVLNQA